MKKYVQAVQACAKGTASEEQQKDAVEWFVRFASRAYDISYRNDPYDTAFAEGRRFVGLEAIKWINTPYHKFFPATKEGQQK